MGNSDHGTTYTYTASRVVFVSVSVNESNGNPKPPPPRRLHLLLRRVRLVYRGTSPIRNRPPPLARTTIGS